MAEQLLCGKQRGDTALIGLGNLEYPRISLMMEGLNQHSLCKKDDRTDCNNYIVFTFYQIKHNTLYNFSLFVTSKKR